VSEANSEAVCQASIAAGIVDSYSQYCSGVTDSGVLENSWRYRYVKRLIDFACASVLFVIFVIPGFLIAAAIVLTSPGPVFYREDRIGRGGRLFKIWKFRSMRQDAPKMRWVNPAEVNGSRMEWRMRKDLNDPRVTSVGRFIRRWSLDEIPQLLNVLCGQMSLIGPRPIVAGEVPYYGDQLSLYIAAMPGLSGLWQVSGRSEVGYEYRAQLDATYVRSWSLGTDLHLLLRTVPAVLCRVGAN